MYELCATASSSQMLFHIKYQVIVWCIEKRPLMLLELNCTSHIHGAGEGKEKRNQSETRCERQRGGK